MKEELQNKRILILGAGTWQSPYLKKAKELGLKVYATDWSPNAEGRIFADVFQPIDLKDKDKTLAFARENKIDAVFTSADIGVQTAAYVARNLGLFYHSEEIAWISTNKFAMREHASGIGLGIPNYVVVETVDEARLECQKIGFPLIVKPVDNFSSRGVSVVENELELVNFFPKSIQASFSKKVLLEEFMTGLEGSVEVLVQDGQLHIMGICSKTKSPLPYRYDLSLKYPGEFSNEQFRQIEIFVKKLASGYGIQNGILHVEIMVTGTLVRLIEFAIRGCGSKVITHLMPAMLNYDVVEHLILQSFGLKKEICFSTGNFGILEFLILPEGKIKMLEGVDEVRQIPGILDFDIERKPGDEIGKVEDGRSRPGYLLAYSNLKSELENLVSIALQTFRVTYF